MMPNILLDVEYVERLKTELAEALTHNKQLLNDKDASPAIIAGYRDYNKRLQKALAAQIEKDAAIAEQIERGRFDAVGNPMMKQFVSYVAAAIRAQLVTKQST